MSYSVKLEFDLTEMNEVYDWYDYKNKGIPVLMNIFESSCILVKHKIDDKATFIIIFVDFNCQETC